MTRDRRSRGTLSGFTAHEASSARIAEDTKQTRDTTLPSPVRAFTTSKVGIDQYPIPQIQGVVPGIRRARQPTSSTNSLVSRPSTANGALTANTPFSIQDEKTAILSTNVTKTTHSTASQQSNYPRASPPCFLYPVPIVPYTFPPAQPSTDSPEHTHSTYTETLQQNISTPPMVSKTQRSDAALFASLPLSLKLLFLITLSVIVLGVICTLLAFCINFPPGTWAIFRSERRDSDAAIVEYTTNQTEADTELHAYNNNNNDGTTHRSTRQGGITTITQPSSSHRRHSYTPQDDAVSAHFSPRHSLPATSSPYNPFLDPPGVQHAGVQQPGRVYRVKVRSSREWREAHAAFFGGGGGGEGNTAKAIMASEAKTEARGVSEDGSASAMEQKENGNDERSGEDTVVSKGVMWVDQRLGMLDGAMDEAAAKIATWAEDKKLD